MSYQKVHQEYGEADDEDNSLIELTPSGHHTLRSRRRLGPKTALDRLNQVASPVVSNPSFYHYVALFIVALFGIYFMGLHNGRAQVVSKYESPPVDSEPYNVLHGGLSQSSTNSLGSFSLEKLKATKDEAEKLIKMLEEYYFSVNQTQNMLLMPWQDPWDLNTPPDSTNSTSNDLRIGKLVDTMARALVTDEQDTFLMGGIGSSVMAGHDNCRYDSFESQMERTLGPVWEAAGMSFVFQNAGEGGGCNDSHQNQIFCVKQNISPNIDIVHYEWSYFESGGAESYHEMLIRWTQMLPKQPPLHIYNTGFIKRTNEDKLVEHYASYGFNTFYMLTAFTLGGYDYESEKNRQEDPLDRFGWGQHGDGYHERTRYGELETDDLRRESLSVVMRNWHPGPLAFQLVADAYSYLYAKTILKALELIEIELNDGNDPREKWSASKRPILLKHDLPEPVFCDPQYCVVSEAPGCLNFELPTFGTWGARIEDPTDELNVHLGENQNWTIWHQDNDIWYMNDAEDIKYFTDREDKEICRFLDACGGVSAQKVDDGMVVFRLPKMEVGLVVVCACCGQDIGEKTFKSNPNIEIMYNTVRLDPETFDIWPNNKCVRLLQKFPTHGRESETPTGHAYLSIKVTNDMDEAIKLSHVITL